MSEKSSQFSITEITPAYWRITFNNPPLNLLTPESILELQEIVGRIESNAGLHVVVFDSAHPDFFIARYDLSRAAETPVQPGPTGLPTWVDLTTRLSQRLWSALPRCAGASAALAVS
jgi:enoyl-CoA hydratase/carnithine racemase